MPFGATSQSVMMAGAVCGAAAVVIGGVIQGAIFHKFQKLTPSTWRPEGPRQYALGTLARLLVGVGFPLVFAYTGYPVNPMKSVTPTEYGAMFGLLAWAALTLPMILSSAVFVNYHKGFVVGLLLDWLLIAVVCGIACASLEKSAVPAKTAAAALGAWLGG